MPSDQEMPKPLPTIEGGWKTIVADPPWPYADRLPGPGRGAVKHYRLMTIQEIADLPVADTAASASHLYLWTTNGFMAEAHDICRAWGFDLKSIITWVKVTKEGRPRLGMGRTFRNVTEHCLFGVRGRAPVLRNNVPNVLFAQRTRHSEKPDSFYDLVESMSEGQFLEMFARRGRAGWESWGDESPSG